MSNPKKNYNSEYEYVPISHEQQYLEELFNWIVDNLEYINRLPGPYRRLIVDKTYQKPSSQKKPGV